ncbi:Probable WRKY transcription factor 53 [Linum perenne]
MNTHPQTTSLDDDWEQKCTTLAAELASGRDVAKQLQHILLPPPTSSSPSSSQHHDGVREMLVKKILVSYENALFLLNQQQPNHPTGSGQVVYKSECSPPPPPSMNGSPRSEDSDRDGSPDVFVKDNVNPTSRKRKSSVPRWTHQVKVKPGMGLEGPLDDGFSWRKYGQKDILGAKHPRGYYRCTLRNVQGCLATKQVQRSDQDPTIFEITYRGRHTCSAQTSPQPPPPPSAAADTHDDHLLLNFQRGLNVITDDLELINSTFPSPPVQASSFTSFFPPPPLPPTNSGNFFPSPATSSFVAPTSSTIYHHVGLGMGCPASSSGGSTPTSAAAAGGLVDFPFESLDLFDDYPTTTTTYGFDNSGFFS